VLTILLVVTALAGAVLNILKRWQGFALWIVADAGLAAVNFTNGELAQCALWCVYTGLATWGLTHWLRHPPER
jgi:nicotinamide riboside transporter PnuC